MRDIEKNNTKATITESASSKQQRCRRKFWCVLAVVVLMGGAVAGVVTYFLLTRSDTVVEVVETSAQETLPSLIKAAPIGEGGAILLEYTESLEDPTKLFYYINVQDLDFESLEVDTNNLALYLAESTEITIEELFVSLLASENDNPAITKQSDVRSNKNNAIRIGLVNSVDFPFRLEESFLPGDFNGVFLVAEEQNNNRDVTLEVVSRVSFDIVVAPEQNIVSPTVSPTSVPPTSVPSINPSAAPSASPSTSPSTNSPTKTPTNSPTKLPTLFPTTVAPTKSPTPLPTRLPTALPTRVPTVGTNEPTASMTPTSPFPTQAPSTLPTQAPSHLPTQAPSRFPTHPPTNRPTSAPTHVPTQSPTRRPSRSPTRMPTPLPTMEPTTASRLPILTASLSGSYRIGGTITIDYNQQFQNGGVVSVPVLQFDIPRLSSAPGPHLYLSKRPFSQTRRGKLSSDDIYIPMDEVAGGEFAVSGRFDQFLDEINNVEDLNDYVNGSWIVWCRPFGVWIGGGPITIA